MRLSIVKGGNGRGLTPEGFARDAKRQMWQDVKQGMERGGAKIAARARVNVRSALRGNRAANSIQHRVYARDRNRFPALRIASKIPWLGMHERGGVISGRMLIPFGDKRMKRSAWKALVKRLFAEGRAYFITRGSTKILMARPGEKGGGISKFRSAFRQRLRSQGGTGRIRRDQPVPIAIAVTRVTIRKRLSVGRIIRESMSTISAEALA